MRKKNFNPYFPTIILSVVGLFQRQDLVSSLAGVGDHDDIETKVVIWQQRQELAIQRWQLLIGDLRQVATLEFSMIAVALKELRQLVRCSAENTEF